MCGIIGYVGKKSAGPILIEGLRRLEYRGYDSAGVAALEDGRLEVRRKAGRIDQGLALLVQARPLHGTVGIGHTRWATHGPPTDENSHPHLDASGKIAVVHNGVIENYDRLKQRLRAVGHQFRSDTDTEVLAHLIGEHYARLKSPNGSPHSLAQAVSGARSGKSSARTGLGSSARIFPASSSARGAVRRSSSASASVNIFWPATRRQWHRTPVKWCISRTTIW